MKNILPFIKEHKESILYALKKWGPLSFLISFLYLLQLFGFKKILFFIFSFSVCIFLFLQLRKMYRLFDNKEFHAIFKEMDAIEKIFPNFEYYQTAEVTEDALIKNPYMKIQKKSLIANNVFEGEYGYKKNHFLYGTIQIEQISGFYLSCAMPISFTNTSTFFLFNERTLELDEEMLLMEYYSVPLIDDVAFYVNHTLSPKDKEKIKNLYYQLKEKGFTYVVGNDTGISLYINEWMPYGIISIPGMSKVNTVINETVQIQNYMDILMNYLNEKGDLNE
ncbi:MAG: hypothetical protein RSC93_11045 [Erysipelotrichaceae bacterium]